MENKKEELVNVSYQDIITFRNVAINYQNRHEKKFSKFLYGLQRAIDHTEQAFKKFQKEQEELRIDLSAKDEKGFVITDEKDNFKFKAEDNKKLLEKTRELLEQKVYIKPYIVSFDQIPNDIGINIWNYFVPFILPQLTEEIIEQLEKRK